MKFGKTLKRVMHAPWAEKYVDYKSLKQLIKRVSASLEAFLVHQSASEADTTLLNIGRRAFFHSIGAEVAKINAYYMAKLDEWESAYETLLSQSDAGAKLASLRSLCDSLDKLRSYVLVNHLAFVKILKKYDKHAHIQSIASQTMQTLFVDVESASLSVMQSIIQSSFYSSPRLGLLIAAVHVQMTQIQQAIDQNQCNNQSISQAIDREQTMLIDTHSNVISTKDQSVTQSVQHSLDTSLHQSIDPAINQTIGQTQSQTESLIEWTCPICLDVLNLPVILSCSHKFCFNCLANWSYRSHQPRCPVCRLIMPISPESITVCSMLDEFLKTYYPHNQAEKQAENQSNNQPEIVAQTANGEFDDDLMGVSKHQSSQSVDRSSPHKHHKAKPGTSLTDRTVNHITHFSDILSVCVPGSYVALDIDDTLFTNLHAPCLLTSARGVEAYQAILARNPLYSGLSVRHRNSITRVLQCALDAKRMVESDTALIVKQLQTVTGCKVFGLTKRFANSAADTRRELLSMGIDFVAPKAQDQCSNPFPAGRKYFDEMTESLLIDGVIYTNGHEKGPVLDRFMSQVLYQRHIDKSCEDASFHQSINEWSKMCYQSASQSSSHPCSAFSPLPINLVFVDDLVENAYSVLQDVSLTQRFCIPTYACAYHSIKHQTERYETEYRAKITEMCELHQDPMIAQHSLHTDMEILQYQVYHLVHQREVINDHDAKLMVTQLKHKAANDQLNSSQPISQATSSRPISSRPIQHSISQSDEPRLKMRASTPTFGKSSNQSNTVTKHCQMPERVDYMEVES